MNKATSALLIAALLTVSPASMPAQAPAGAAPPAAPVRAQWVDGIQYQAVDGTWHDGSLRILGSDVSLYRDKGGRYPLATLSNGTYVDASQKSNRRWLRTALIGVAAAAGTYAAWRYSDAMRQNTDAVITTGRYTTGLPFLGPNPPSYACDPNAPMGDLWRCPDEEYRRHWMWGGAAAGGGTLTWLSWRGKANRSSITLSSQAGQVRIRTAPKERHEALARRLRQVLEGSDTLTPLDSQGGALHPYPIDWIDERSRPAGTQWLR